MCARAMAALRMLLCVPQSWPRWRSKVSFLIMLSIISVRAASQEAGKWEDDLVTPTPDYDYTATFDYDDYQTTSWPEAKNKASGAGPSLSLPLALATIHLNM
ncbi:uncharacterized protein LOC144057486 [Vanacampus margaritifer]